MRAAVIGVGLIGGSLAGALGAAGYEVIGHDTEPTNLETARRMNLIDYSAGALPDAARGADVIVVATPVARIGELLHAIDCHASSSALITDVGSVKEPIVRVMESLGRPERAIGGHPIAGRESSGPENASPTLFHGRVFALAPTARTSDRTISQAMELVRAIGATPVVVAADRHDEVVARTSHVPQLLSTALALSLDPGDLQLAGPGLRDMTRLAFSDPALWTEIVSANQGNILASMRAVSVCLSELIADIEACDMEKLAARMQEAAAAIASLRTGESS